MKNIFVLILLFIYTTVLGYDTVDFDTVEVKSKQGQIHKQWIEARNTGNESQFKKYGTYRAWSTMGFLEEVGFYYWGSKESVFSTWYSSNNRKSVTNYLYGKKHGRHTEWFYNDFIKTDIYYKKDQLNGLCVWRDFREDINNIENGITKKAFYVEGKELVAFIEGDLFYNKSPYYNDEYDLSIEWINLNPYSIKPVLFFVGRLKDGKKHGKWITYNIAGEIQDIDLYQDGVIVTVED
ncbi:MAG TPA: hypothetical protein ENH23_06160 [candidate division Zixibacteria bacterium]|nr:hypothetical protein [candidate division Zixibacteria bacterium]